MNNWIQDAIFYHIYPLGFCNALFRNNFSISPENRLNIIYDWIDHLKNLGINAIYFGPVFESEYHGYDTVDYYNVDRRLSTNENFKKIVDNLHNNGIKVIIDGVFNHTGRKFWAFRDLQQNTYQSQFKDWYYGIDFSKRSAYNDPFSYHSWNGHYNLVKLNLKNNDVKNHLFGAVKNWISEFNIDGLRLDAADCLDIQFIQELNYMCKSIKSDFWIMCEIIHGNYSNWANGYVADSTTNYEIYKGLYSSHNDVNYFEIAYSLNREFSDMGIYKNIILYNFSDNHDVDRVSSKLKNKMYLFPLYAMLFTMPGVPSIYYGSEWGIEGVKNNGSDNSLRPYIDINTIKDNVEGLRQWISKLIKIRKNNIALKLGNYKQLHINHQQFVFERFFSGEEIVVAFNSSDVYSKINVSKNGKYLDLISENKTFISNNGSLSIEIEPFSALILKKM